MDREIHFNTSRKNELLRELRGVMNVLSYGEPAAAKVPIYIHSSTAQLLRFADSEITTILTVKILVDV